MEHDDAEADVQRREGVVDGSVLVKGEGGEGKRKYLSRDKALDEQCCLCMSADEEEGKFSSVDWVRCSGCSAASHLLCLKALRARPVPARGAVFGKGLCAFPFDSSQSGTEASTATSSEGLCGLCAFSRQTGASHQKARCVLCGARGGWRELLFDERPFPVHRGCLEFSGLLKQSPEGLCFVNKNDLLAAVAAAVCGGWLCSVCLGDGISSERGLPLQCDFPQCKARLHASCALVRGGRLRRCLIFKNAAPLLRDSFLKEAGEGFSREASEANGESRELAKSERVVSWRGVFCAEHARASGISGARHSLFRALQFTKTASRLLFSKGQDSGAVGGTAVSFTGSSSIASRAQESGSPGALSLSGAETAEALRNAAPANGAVFGAVAATLLKARSGAAVDASSLASNSKAAALQTNAAATEKGGSMRESSATGGFATAGGGAEAVDAGEAANTNVHAAAVRGLSLQWSRFDSRFKRLLLGVYAPQLLGDAGNASETARAIADAAQIQRVLSGASNANALAALKALTGGSCLSSGSPEDKAGDSTCALAPLALGGGSVLKVSSQRRRASSLWEGEGCAGSDALFAEKEALLLPPAAEDCETLESLAEKFVACWGGEGAKAVVVRLSGVQTAKAQRQQQPPSQKRQREDADENVTQPAEAPPAAETERSCSGGALIRSSCGKSNKSQQAPQSAKRAVGSRGKNVSSSTSTLQPPQFADAAASDASSAAENRMGEADALGSSTLRANKRRKTASAVPSDGAAPLEETPAKEATHLQRPSSPPPSPSPSSLHPRVRVLVDLGFAQFVATLRLSSLAAPAWLHALDAEKQLLSAYTRALAQTKEAAALGPLFALYEAALLHAAGPATAGSLKGTQEARRLGGEAESGLVAALDEKTERPVWRVESLQSLSPFLAEFVKRRASLFRAEAQPEDAVSEIQVDFAASEANSGQPEGETAGASPPLDEASFTQTATAAAASDASLLSAPSLEVARRSSSAVGPLAPMASLAEKGSSLVYASIQQQQIRSSSGQWISAAALSAAGGAAALNAASHLSGNLASLAGLSPVAASVALARAPSETEFVGGQLLLKPRVARAAVRALSRVKEARASFLGASDAGAWAVAARDGEEEAVAASAREGEASDLVAANLDATLAAARRLHFALEEARASLFDRLEEHLLLAPLRVTEQSSLESKLLLRFAAWSKWKHILRGFDRGHRDYCAVGCSGECSPETGLCAGVQTARGGARGGDGEGEASAKAESAVSGGRFLRMQPLQQSQQSAEAGGGADSGGSESDDETNAGTLCCVCWSELRDPANRVMRCGCCGVTVHRHCYAASGAFSSSRGLSAPPRGAGGGGGPGGGSSSSWACARCEWERRMFGLQQQRTHFCRATSVCCVCGRKGGAFKRALSSRWQRLAAAQNASAVTNQAHPQQQQQHRRAALPSGGGGAGVPFDAQEAALSESVQFVHLNCALWLLPAARCLDILRLEPWDFSAIKAPAPFTAQQTERRLQVEGAGGGFWFDDSGVCVSTPEAVCCVCGVVVGFVKRCCAREGCAICVHPSCAWLNGFYVRVRSAPRPFSGFGCGAATAAISALAGAASSSPAAGGEGAEGEAASSAAPPLQFLNAPFLLGAEDAAELGVAARLAENGGEAETAEASGAAGGGGGRGWGARKEESAAEKALRGALAADALLPQLLVEVFCPQHTPPEAQNRDLAAQQTFREERALVAGLLTPASRTPAGPCEGGSGLVGEGFSLSASNGGAFKRHFEGSLAGGGLVAHPHQATAFGGGRPSLTSSFITRGKTETGAARGAAADEAFEEKGLVEAKHSLANAFELRRNDGPLLPPDAYSRKACAVCFRGGCHQSPLVVCGGCGVAVHSACYGDPAFNPGFPSAEGAQQRSAFYCDVCAAQQNPNAIACLLCPRRGGAFKLAQPTGSGVGFGTLSRSGGGRAADGKSAFFVHCLCALMAPSPPVKFADNAALSPVFGVDVFASALQVAAASTLAGPSSSSAAATTEGEGLAPWVASVCAVCSGAGGFLVGCCCKLSSSFASPAPALPHDSPQPRWCGQALHPLCALVSGLRVEHVPVYATDAPATATEGEGLQTLFFCAAVRNPVLWPTISNSKLGETPPHELLLREKTERACALQHSALLDQMQEAEHKVVQVYRQLQQHARMLREWQRVEQTKLELMQRLRGIDTTEARGLRTSAGGAQTSLTETKTTL